jgi:tetratricopeptide (TPR) repeat protein
MQYRYSKKMVDMYIQRPDLISSYPRFWLMSLNNYLIACNAEKRFDEMRAYLYKLEFTRKRLQAVSDRAAGFSYLYHLLNYYIGLGLYDEAAKDVRRIEAEMPEHDPVLNQPQKIILYTLISQVYFGQKNYKLSLSWLNKIMASGEMKMRRDIECFVKLFYLVVHYEMKSDRDLMGSLFRSTYRFLYKRDRLYRFEAAVMDFIKKNLLKDIDRHNIKKQFIKLRIKLLRIVEDPLERNLLDYFDFISWLESKIEGKPFAAVIKRKNTIREKSEI